MIPIRRLDEPEVLKKNKAKWLAAFMERRAVEPGKRPQSSQYAHEQVVRTLEGMSCSDPPRLAAKQPDTSIPVTDCLDPCDPSARPSEHLDFDDEMIRARPGSQKGSCTITKYTLDRVDLDHKRQRQLRRLDRTVISIQQRMIAEGRKTMTAAEKDLLRSFAQPDYPFSLMFTIYLERSGLLDRDIP